MQLRRSRRVVFFSDDTGDVDLHAPLIPQRFVAAPNERIFSGGNWRAVPILRAMAEAFFSDEAQAAMAKRGEPPPKWAYMADDDSFAFHSELLSTLSEYDPDKPHYLGCANSKS